MKTLVQKILDYYLVEVLSDLKHREWIYCCCPFHEGSGKTPHNFNIHRVNGRWMCFSKCGTGSLRDLVAKLEDCSPLQAGEKIEEFADGGVTWGVLSARQVKTPESAVVTVRPDSHEFHPIPESHPFLESRGFKAEDFEAFDVSIDFNKLDRVFFPIYFECKLKGYSARMIGSEMPKWRHDKGIGTSKILYNFDVASEKPYVIIVEGILDAIRVHSFGYHGVVALFGATASKEQLALIVENWDNVVVALDGDEAGWKGSSKIIKRLLNKVEVVSTLSLQGGRDPDSLNKEEFLSMMSTRTIVSNNEKIAWTDLTNLSKGI